MLVENWWNKMAFDWEEYQEFDWEQFGTEEAPAAPTPPAAMPAAPTPPPAPVDTGPSQLEAGLRGGLQGLTLGYADEIQGALEAAGGAISDFDLSNIVERYRQERDEARGAYTAAQQAHPGTFTGAEIAGGLGSLLIPGLGAAKGIKGAAMVGGAAAGGLSEADLTRGEVGQLATDVGLGAGLGAGVGAAIGRAPALFRGAKAKAQELPLIGEFLKGRQLGKTGTDLFTESGRKAAQQEVIDVSNKLGLTSEAARKEIGENIGEIRKNLAKTGQTVNIEDEISLIENTIKKLQKSDDPGAKSDVKRLRKYLTGLMRGKKEVLPDYVKTATKTRVGGLDPEEALLGKAEEVQKTLTRLAGTRETAPVLKTQDAINVAKSAAAGIGEKVGTVTPELAEQTKNYKTIMDAFRALGIKPKKDIITDEVTGKLALTPQAQVKVANLLRAKGKDAPRGLAQLDKAMQLLKKGAPSAADELTPDIQRASEIANILGVPARDIIPAIKSGSGVIGNIMGQIESKAVKALSNSRTLENLSKTIREKSPDAGPLATRLMELSKLPDMQERLVGVATLMADPTTKSEINRYLADIPKDVEVRTPKVIQEEGAPRPSFDKNYSEEMIHNYQLNITPEMGTAGESLRNILNGMKEKSLAQRKAMMFALEQNPVYRPLLKKLRLDSTK